jgi:hypothetical protein
VYKNEAQASFLATITFFLSSSVLAMFILCLFACYSYFVLHLLDTSF